ncbi:MAG: 4-phosphoerythronate dehydrogenase [Candidatus Hydrogenedentales bacterium]
MHILVDQALPFASEAFSPFGDVTVLPGAEISAATVHDADALFVRSGVRVNAALLESSRVRFVGTATAGTDHIDVDYLRQHNITFAEAAGSNAESVADWFVAALLELAARHNLDYDGMKLGIVGVGHVGSAVMRRTAGFFDEFITHDPPLGDDAGDTLFDCDVITIHTPLTDAGPYPTRNMLDAEWLAQMKPGCILINAARGGIVDEAALIDALDSGHIRACAIDVWTGEPHINAELLRRADIATPHIAGHSYDGKVACTQLMHNALANFLGVSPNWNSTAVLAELESSPIVVNQIEIAPDDYRVDLYNIMRNVVAQVYDIRNDDAAFRDILSLPGAARPDHFRQLRRNYPRRREFSGTPVQFSPEWLNTEMGRSVAKTFAMYLTGIGFTRISAGAEVWHP